MIYVIVVTFCSLFYTRNEENEEAYHVLKALLKAKQKLVGGGESSVESDSSDSSDSCSDSSVELARSHFYLGTICIEASKITMACLLYTSDAADE